MNLLRLLGICAIVTIASGACRPLTCFAADAAPTSSSAVQTAAIDLLKACDTAASSWRSFRAECDTACIYPAVDSGKNWQKQSSLVVDGKDKLQYVEFTMEQDAVAGTWGRQTDPCAMVVADGTSVWSEDDHGNVTQTTESSSLLATHGEPWASVLPGAESAYASVIAAQKAGKLKSVSLGPPEDVDGTRCSVVQADYQASVAAGECHITAAWYIDERQVVIRRVETVVEPDQTQYTLDARLRNVQIDKKIDKKEFVYTPFAVRRYNELTAELKPANDGTVDPVAVDLLRNASTPPGSSWRTETLTEYVSGGPSFEKISLFHHERGPITAQSMWESNEDYCAMPASEVRRSTLVTDSPGTASSSVVDYVADGHSVHRRLPTSPASDDSSAPLVDPGSSMGRSLAGLLAQPLSEVRFLGKQIVNGVTCDRIYVQLNTSGPRFTESNDGLSKTWNQPIGGSSAAAYVWYVGRDATIQRLDANDGDGLRSVTLKKFTLMPDLKPTDPMFSVTP